MYTVHCIVYFYTGVFLAVNQDWVIIKFESHPCLSFIGEKKNGFGIWNSILFLPNFQGLIPLKMWLRRALMWLNLYDCQAVLKKGNFRAKKWYNFTKNILISQTLKG